MKGYYLNPTLELKRQGGDFELFWKDLKTDQKHREKPSPYDLLALKLVLEDRDLREVAHKEAVSLSVLKGVLRLGVKKGYLLKEPTRVVRSGSPYKEAWFPGEDFRRSEIFTLQWHLTQRCDLACRHCYDRTDRRPLNLKEALRVLDRFYDFCEEMRVQGQISFSGGNPFLHPDFFELYREASERDFTLAILGNPVPEAWFERILAIEPPAYYQVSLEGLEAYNDFIRGPGHFRRTLSFLEMLKDSGVSASVMLTLHAGNVDQVLPLARSLSGRVETFTFNRLALTGEGRKLSPAERDTFFRLMVEFLEESANLPHLHLKDNLFNHLLYRKKDELCGGCTGFGCGAAFNFVALLPDGEVHACRKFSSYLGNIFENDLLEIYHSERSEKYRRGPEACYDCRLYAICRGCLAVIATSGLDPFRDRDPFCPGPVN
ncbi:thio(seleno)oxazole modification radical SAM maturase SbtM [Thermosulfurimonas dismutans]|uniref:Radical SAM domain protein n=1 Tax=Thermosulfurimonas dismutans TaxID=999894 RepID=A0A179D664_9BACT|nr:thio(seleno)oxazole modification radical SAM maturase SbtM [Thermosulfurimonas dismutans]OAQ21590.1 radical SAM domain protein [Thermosulfurimonas dismutans]